MGSRRAGAFSRVKPVQDGGEPVAYGGAVSPTRNRPSPPSLDGEIRRDDRARAAAADDFGHLTHRTPEGVLLPASAEDVAATVRWAAAQGRRFAAQGNRHSVFGRAQVRDGVVADMRRLRAIHDLQDDQVVVDAGATWREVLTATLPGAGASRRCFPTTSTCRSAAPCRSAASAAGPGGRAR